MKVSSSSPLNIGSCWPGSNMKGMPWAAQSRACFSMPSRPSGAMIATRSGPQSATLFSCENCIAPGWKALIWLLSWSAVTKHCAV